MPHATVDLAYRLANLLLATAALSVAASIAVEIGRRPTGRREPLGITLCVVFLALALHGAVRALTDDVAIGAAGSSWTGLVFDGGAAAAVVAFLALRRRYAMFIETADVVREYETGYAAKAREARALAQVNEELRRLDELKSEFLAMVSHELRTPQYLPIIAVSAPARPQEREAALHAGCDAYLSKPFLPDELARVVATTLLNEGVATR